MKLGSPWTVPLTCEIPLKQAA